MLDATLALRFENATAVGQETNLVSTLRFFMLTGVPLSPHGQNHRNIKTTESQQFKDDFDQFDS
jgi:hypothetical protein